MSTQQQIKQSSEQSIVDYLRCHPDFFTRHEELLAIMEIRHAQGSTVSLVERQLTVLRDENQQLQRKLEYLIAIAQQNEQLNQRIQRLIVALVGATSADDFFNNLYDILHHEFNTDAVVVKIFELPKSSLIGRQEFVEYDAQVFTLFEGLLGNNEPTCGQLSPEQIHYLFPEDHIASAVLIPLGVPKPNGILAIGSQDVGRFHVGMATDLLKYMGQLVSQLMRFWLQN